MRNFVLCISVSVLGLACGGDDGPMDSGILDGAVDGSFDAGNDAGFDAGDDAGDAGFDAGDDAGDDGGVDAGDDGGIDAGDDGGVDAGDDGGVDAGFDAGFDAGGTTDGVAPVVTIAFPPPVSLTDTAQVVMRGTATDADGVAGHSRERCGRNLQRWFSRRGRRRCLWRGTPTTWSWSPRMPVAPPIPTRGPSPFGSRPRFSAIPTTSPWTRREDGSLERAISGAGTSFFTVDPTTGERTVVSGPDRGAGTDLRAVMGMAWDATGAQLLGVGLIDGSLYAIDPVTGDRSVLTGSGPTIVRPYDITLNATDTTAYVVMAGEWSGPER